MSGQTGQEELPTVYIETSVISYLTSRPSRDLLVAAEQQVTRDWWERALPRFRPFISPLVVWEVGRGDPAAAGQRQAVIVAFEVLGVPNEAVVLAEAYMDALRIPPKARFDAYHLAIASWHGMDFLVSWNCKHIANGRVRRILEELNNGRGVRTPEICTPLELMENESDV